MKWLTEYQSYGALRRLRYTAQMKLNDAEKEGMKLFPELAKLKEIFIWQRWDKRWGVFTVFVNYTGTDTFNIHTHKHTPGQIHSL